MSEKVSLSAYVAASSAVVASLTLNDWAALVGIICAAVTAAGNLYYKRKMAGTINRKFCEQCPLKD